LEYLRLIADFFAQSAFIDPDLDASKLAKADLAKCKSLQNFLKHHGHSSQYAFQLKKCTSTIVLNILFGYQHLPLKSYPTSLYLFLMLQENTTRNLMICMALNQMKSIDLRILQSHRMNQRRKTRRTKDCWLKLKCEEQ
jgi:hypothetical protein